MNPFGTGLQAELEFIAVGIVVFILFFVAGRMVSGRVAQALRQRGVRHDMVVVGTRVILFVIIGVGAAAGASFAFQSGNVALFGIVATVVVASFGVQDVLKDYVSGYYVLLERHIKVGDKISGELYEGLVTDIKLRVTLLRNETGHTIVVPNSELFNNPVTIESRPGPASVVEVKPAPPT